MIYDKVLYDIGFQKMEENINGSKINELFYDKYHLYLRYILVIDKVKNYFWLVDYKGDSVGPIHDMSMISKINSIYLFDPNEILRMKSDYREYQINKLGI